MTRTSITTSHRSTTCVSLTLQRLMSQDREVLSLFFFRQICLGSRLQQLAPVFLESRPDLRQETTFSIAMENDLPFLPHRATCDLLQRNLIGQYHGNDLPVRVLDLELMRLDNHGVLACGKTLVRNHKVEGNLSLHSTALRVSRNHNQPDHHAETCDDQRILFHGILLCAVLSAGLEPPRSPTFCGERAHFHPPPQAEQWIGPG